jgi:hypothetical protein
MMLLFRLIKKVIGVSFLLFGVPFGVALDLAILIGRIVVGVALFLIVFVLGGLLPFLIGIIGALLYLAIMLGKGAALCFAWIITFGGLYYAATNFSTVAQILLGLPFGVLLIAAVLKPQQIMAKMLGLLRVLYIQPVKTELYQLPGDIKNSGAIVTFVCSRKDFFELRAAANLAGIWFGHTEYEFLSAGMFFYSVLAVPLIKD